MTGGIEKGVTDQIEDLTEQDLINLRRTIYLTIMSSAGFEECAHKLAKLDIPGTCRGGQGKGLGLGPGPGPGPGPGSGSGLGVVSARHT